MGGGVGCPPRGDAAARCHFNHNPLPTEHKGHTRLETEILRGAVSAPFGATENVAVRRVFVGCNLQFRRASAARLWHGLAAARSCVLLGCVRARWRSLQSARSLLRASRRSVAGSERARLAGATENYI